MSERTTAPYGTWPSPIGAADVARAGIRLGAPSVRGRQVWWQETRPDADGRTTICHRAADGTRRALLAAPWDARTRMHEYGGRSYLPVARDGGEFTVVFTDYADQRMYALDPGASEPRPLTPRPAGSAQLRYGEFVHHAGRDEIWCVREHHDGTRVNRALVAVPLSGSAADNPADVRSLVHGWRFFTSPALSPDGGRLAWTCWNHPQMPWDGTQLRVATVAADGSVGPSHLVKGGTSESVLAPHWRDDTSLYVLSDWSGWWNLYRVDIFGAPPISLYPAEEEFAAPPWSLGHRPYVVLDDGRIVVQHGVGDRRLAILDPDSADLTDLDVPYPSWTCQLDGEGGTVVGIAAGPKTPTSVVRIDVPTGRVEALRRELQELPDTAYLPEPRHEEFAGPGGRSVHAWVYEPANPAVAAPDGEPAPYVIWAHGGPTSQVDGVLDLTKAYFTSRGIGVVDVNYAGSSGYGRHHRGRLRGQWGIADVADVDAVARALAEQHRADPDRLAIRGGSAGGWTTLGAVTGDTVFAAGASYFGVSDARDLAAETHDFESRYLDGLIGPLPQFEDRYIERAPVCNAARTHCPVLLLQGLDDPVVPPGQSARFAAALATAGVPYVYLEFEGESHGFRKATTIVACLEAELSFYGQTLGFTPPDIPHIDLVHGSAPISVRVTEP